MGAEVYWSLYSAMCEKSQTFVVYEEARSAMEGGVLVSEDDVELVGRAGHDERETLLTATHRDVTVVARRLTQHSIEMTRRRLCGRWSPRCRLL